MTEITRGQKYILLRLGCLLYGLVFGDTSFLAM